MGEPWNYKWGILNCHIYRRVFWRCWTMILSWMEWGIFSQIHIKGSWLVHSISISISISNCGWNVFFLFPIWFFAILVGIMTSWWCQFLNVQRCDWDDRFLRFTWSFTRRNCSVCEWTMRFWSKSGSSSNDYFKKESWRTWWFPRNKNGTHSRKRKIDPERLE